MIQPLPLPGLKKDFQKPSPQHTNIFLNRTREVYDINAGTYIYDFISEHK